MSQSESGLALSQLALSLFRAHKGVHIHLFHVLDLDLRCFFTQLGSDAPVTSRATRDHSWPSLKDKVLPLLVHIQAPADNQFESMLALLHVSLPRYSSRQCGFHGLTLRDCCVSLRATREKNPPPVNTRHQDRFHRTKLCIQRQISRVLMYKETTFRNLPTVNVNHPHHVCRPGTKSSFQQSRLVFHVANVTTFLHVGQDRSSPILSANPTPIQA